MALLNIDIPIFYAQLSDKHTDHNSKAHWYNIIVFAAQSRAGRALLFHVRMEDGYLRSNVPLHMIRHCESELPQYSYDMLQLWDCFGDDVTVTVFEYLVNRRMVVKLKDGTEVAGTYMMTFDWLNNQYSDTPQDYKCGHMIKLDNGQFAIQPNNRIVYVHDMNFGKGRQTEIPKFKADSELFVCERGEKWIVTDNNYNYDVKDGQ